MIEFIASLLLFPIIFWGLLTLFIIGSIYKVEDESLGASFSLFLGVIGLGILKYGSFSDLYDYVKENPSTIIVLVVAYFIVGIIWSFFKWYLFLKNNKVTSNISKTYVSVEYNREKIITWIIVWVPSMTWFLINDPVRRVGNFIYYSLSNSYQRMSDKICKVTEVK